MTLKEAIAHHRWAAENCLGEVCDEHSQMVGWLEELVRCKRENAELREMLSESRQANEHIFTELKRYKSVMRTRPIAMNALFDENTKLRKLLCELYEDQCDEHDRWRYRDRMRELGVGATDE